MNVIWRGASVGNECSRINWLNYYDKLRFVLFDKAAVILMICLFIKWQIILVIGYRYSTFTNVGLCFK